MTRSILAVFGLLSAAAYGGMAYFEVGEPDDWYRQRVATDASIGTVSLGAIPSDLYDVRGVGDSAWTHPGGADGRQSEPPLPRMAGALARADSDGKIFRGHLNFINWESVVGEHCDSIRGVEYYFLSHPGALAQAIAHGFNLFSLSNNHARDCDMGRATTNSVSRPGPLMTAEAMARLKEETPTPLLWTGVGARSPETSPYLAKVERFDNDGRSVRVAFAAVALLGWDIPGAATFDYRSLPGAQVRRTLESLRTAEADLRILSIHTQDGSNSRKEDGAFIALKSISEDFVRNYGGDIVFGQGPHTWGGVRVIEKSDGRRGVVFTSLGNFLHQGLGSNRDNYLGRALFDRDSLRLREVQVYPFVNTKTSLSFYGTHRETKAPRANFEWTRVRYDGSRSALSGYSARFD